MRILISALVAVTLAEMMFAMGLRVSFSGLLSQAKSNRWLILRAVIANYLVVPLLTVVFILVFNVPPMVATGLLILGCTPAAPYGPPFTLFARGNLALAVLLMVLLAGSSAILVPFLLNFLLGIISSGGILANVDPLSMIGNLFFIQLIPLCLGISVAQWFPEMVVKILKPAGIASKILNGLMISAIMMLQFNVLAGIRLDVVLLIVALVMCGVAVGWLLGWPGRENRISVSVITGMRNMSLSIGIATFSFPGSEVITTVLAYSFIAGVSLLLFSYLIRMTTPTGSPHPDRVTPP